MPTFLKAKDLVSDARIMKCEKVEKLPGKNFSECIWRLPLWKDFALRLYDILVEMAARNVKPQVA